MLQAACMIACGFPQLKRVRKGKTQPKRAYELDFINATPVPGAISLTARARWTPVSLTFGHHGPSHRRDLVGRRGAPAGIIHNSNIKLEFT
jgi:hypothetical protein